MAKAPTKSIFSKNGNIAILAIMVMDRKFLVVALLEKIGDNFIGNEKNKE